MLVDCVFVYVVFRLVVWMIGWVFVLVGLYVVFRGFWRCVWWVCYLFDSGVSVALRFGWF